MGRISALLANIRLALKKLVSPNTLAYSEQHKKFYKIDTRSRLAKVEVKALT
jgi:sugar lactone lactonase YvrE